MLSIFPNSIIMSLIEKRKFSSGFGFSLVGKTKSYMEHGGGSMAKYSLIAIKKSTTPSNFS